MEKKKRNKKQADSTSQTEVSLEKAESQSKDRHEERSALMWELHGEVVNQFLRLIRERPQEVNGAMLGALCAFLRDNGITMKKGTPDWEVEEFLEGLKTDSPFPFGDEEDSEEPTSGEAEDRWSKPEEVYLPFN